MTYDRAGILREAHRIHRLYLRPRGISFRVALAACWTHAKMRRELALDADGRA